MAIHDDCAQLNFSKRCTYNIHLTNTPFAEQRVLSFRNFVINALIYILELAGESELPCLTPLRTSKEIDKKPCHGTLTPSLLYQLASNAI